LKNPVSWHALIDFAREMSLNIAFDRSARLRAVGGSPRSYAA
jgi:hypothetical protein